MMNFSIKKMWSTLALLLLITSATYAQTVVGGTITDSKTKEALIGVSIQVKGKVIGTVSDSKGRFEFTTSTPPPFTILISYVGYQGQEFVVNGQNSNINLSLEEQSILGQEVVVSASRVEEKVLKSPVAVEKMDIRDIRQTASSTFFDALANMKGIDFTTQGLLFKSVNMRGFGATGNPRTVQMIDGMDNSAPGLNFPMDNIVGMPDLDVESVEVLPGAASALYGPNAINGLILMNSKSPFLYQGLSANIKTGVMVADNRDVKTTPLYDFSMRYAKAINNKFAFKANISYLTAKDWQATDYSNLNVGGVQNGTRGAGVKTDYDGMNVYGDEVQSTMGSVVTGLLAANSPLSAAQKAGISAVNAAGLIPSGTVVSRTGILERDLVDYNTKSFKTNLAAHYRINEKVELVGQYNFGYGTTVYTGTGRYSLRNFNLSQVKLELRSNHLLLRAYTTQERSGQSYTAGLAAVAMLNSVKPHASWFGEYVGAFAAARGAGQSEEAAHAAARSVAETGMPQPGTDAYQKLLDTYRDKAIVDGGSAFTDKTNMYHAEAVYNFKDKVKFVELLTGANIRQYQLRSAGTLFADLKTDPETGKLRTGTIPITEYGAFVQASKSMFKDHFKLSASLRYDKNQNFDGQFTPRVSGVFSFGQNNIRLSYQSGFRIPTTQNQYIDLRTPAGTLTGGLDEFVGRYNMSSGIAVATLNAFSADVAKNGAKSIYFTDAVKAKALAYATAAVNAQLPTITAQVTAGVTAAVTQAVNAAKPQIVAGVTAVVTQQVTAAVTTQVNAAIAAGQIPSDQAAAAIAAGVTAQLATPTVQGLIQTNVDATIQSQINANVATALPGQIQATVIDQIGKATAQVIPAYALEALPKYAAKRLQPERIESYEIGYKSLIGKKLFVDAYYYFSRYTNFIGGVSVVVPTVAAGPGLPIESGVGSASTRLGYSRPANTAEQITVKGWAASLNYSLPKGFNIGGNYAFNKLDGFTATPEQQYSGFNTPENRFNLSFGKRIGSGDKFGFNLNLRHQDAYLWEASFNQPTTTGVEFFGNTTVPKITNFDAQVSMKVSSLKSIIKLGGTNIGGKPYIQAFGSAMVGSMYYVSLTFDELLNK